MEGKDNVRVKMISALKAQVEEQKTIAEILKDELKYKGLTIAEVSGTQAQGYPFTVWQISDLLDSKLNKVKRIRPPRSDMLQKEVCRV